MLKYSMASSSINVRILHSGSSAQDNGDCRNHGFWGACRGIGTQLEVILTIGPRHGPLVYPIIQNLSMRADTSSSTQTRKKQARARTKRRTMILSSRAVLQASCIEEFTCAPFRFPIRGPTGLAALFVPLSSFHYRCIRQDNC